MEESQLSRGGGGGEGGREGQKEIRHMLHAIIDISERCYGKARQHNRHKTHLKQPFLKEKGLLPVGYEPTTLAYQVMLLLTKLPRQLARPRQSN